MGNISSLDKEESKYFSSDNDEQPLPRFTTKFVKMGTETENEYVQSGQNDEEEDVTLANPNLMPYSGIWSIVLPPNKGPSPRTGQFHVYSSDYQTIFTGYGIKRGGSLLNDVWALSTVDYSWHKLRLTGDVISPRQGSTAVMMDNYIVIFGGCNEKSHFSELHTIDVTTGEVLIAETGGQIPPAQKGCAIGLYRRKLFVFGGNDGDETIDGLYILDFDTMNWSLFECSVDIGDGFAFTTSRHHIYCYGASQTKSLTIIDMKKQTVSSQKLNEKPPHCEIKGAGMVKANDYLFFFGGRSDDEFTKMYVGNVRNSSWFVFYMLPDGESTSFVDGKISKEGLFLMPDTCDFSCSYVPERRQIFAFFGHPHKSPVPIFIVSIGDALAILNDMEDMRSMLIF